MKYMLQLIFLLAIPFASAATIHGTIYDLDLNPINDAIILIEGPTRQVIVTKDGTYTAEVPLGTYTITVKKNNETIIQEQPTITHNTDHALDLITLQLLDIDLDTDIDEGLTDINELQDEPNSTTLIIGLATTLIALLLIFIAYKQKSKKTQQTTHQELQTDAEELITFIKEQDGRTTQKDIRKAFPYSEAKISLILAELENKKLITKIKKGRGNIIIINTSTPHHQKK